MGNRDYCACMGSGIQVWDEHRMALAGELLRAG